MRSTPREDLGHVGMECYEEGGRKNPALRAASLYLEPSDRKFPLLRERVFKTENVGVFVCPINQKGAFLNNRRAADFPFKTAWE